MSAVRRWGAGRTLLLHCALAHGGVFGPMAEAMAGGGVAVDLPGHGRAPPWDGVGDYQARCVALAADALAEPGPVLGHSFGGTVALRLAVEQPELVTALVLVEPVYFVALKDHDPAAHAAHRASFRHITAAGQAEDLAAMAERFTDMWGGAPWAGLPQRFKETLTAQMPLITAQGPGIEEDSGGVFTPGRVERLRCPVTLIRGSDTQPAVIAIHGVLSRLLPQVREHVVAGAGHMLPVTHAAEVAALTQL